MGVRNSVCAQVTWIPDDVWLYHLVEEPYDMDALQVIMGINRRFRLIGASSIRLRVCRALRVYLPLERQENFIRLLRRHRSVVAGSVALSILIPSHFTSVCISVTSLLSSSRFDVMFTDISS